MFEKNSLEKIRRATGNYEIDQSDLDVLESLGIETSSEEDETALLNAFSYLYPSVGYIESAEDINRDELVIAYQEARKRGFVLGAMESTTIEHVSACINRDKPLIQPSDKLDYINSPRRTIGR